jgi:hypothetical protein
LAETERTQFRRERRVARGEALFVEHVAADDAEFAAALDEQARDVVVAYEQHVDGHVLAVEEQLVAALAEGEPGAAQQAERILRQASGLLHGDAQAFARFVHRAAPARDLRAGLLRDAAIA